MRLEALSHTASHEVSLLASALEFGARRAGTSTSASRWIEERFRDAYRELAVTVSPLRPVDAEATALDLATRRLEILARELVDHHPAFATSGPDQFSIVPMRSGLYAAFTVDTVDGPVVVVDDSLFDLTDMLADLLLGTLTRQHLTSLDDQGNEHSATMLTEPEAARLFRAALGSMRWNGSLWQPVVVTLPSDVRYFARVVSHTAAAFVLAHELSHCIERGRVPDKATVGSESAMLAARTAHDDTCREFAADRQALEAIRSWGRSTDVTEDVLRAAVRVAFAVMAHVEAVHVVAPTATHPPTEQRICRLLGPPEAIATDTIEWSLGSVLRRLPHWSIRSSGTIRELVTNHLSLRWAAPYSADELGELDTIDGAEEVLGWRLPDLLHMIGYDTAPRHDPAPRPVVEAAKAAREQLKVDADDGPQDAPSVAAIISVAVGRHLLWRSLEALPAAERAATMQPAPGTRFVEWALWVERDCPDDEVLPILAALAAYRDFGEQADGLPQGVGLIEAVADWLDG